MFNVLQQYGFAANSYTIQPLGNGLINKTWLVERGKRKFVLQQINASVFKSPAAIAHNIRLVGDYLAAHQPDYLFVNALPAQDGSDLVETNDFFFRLFPFIRDSHTINVVENPLQAYEAARQFGRFTKLLSGFDTRHLKITIPHFHNLTLRYEQFENAMVSGNAERISIAKELISFIVLQHHIVAEFERIIPTFKTRCIHHDTKISNVLFDGDNNGLCVIDLDTLMPGFFISDVGDMMRTYLCPVSEEERDFSKIVIRPAFYDAIKAGYMDEMGEELTADEKRYFLFAGKFMIYMQAIRFLTDYINDDVYYGEKYKDHNFFRAGNQITLLQRLRDFIPG